MEKNIQLFVSVDTKGAILNAQMGKNIVVTDPAFPYVFMIDEETAGRLAEDTTKFKIVIVDFEPELVETNE